MVDILEILGKIGFDWPVALANTVNFLVVFFLLKRFVFPPVKKMITERQKRIQEGLDKAREADVRLQEIDQIGKTKIQEANVAALAMMREAEGRAKQKEQAMEAGMEKKKQDIAALLKADFAKKQQQADRELAAQAQRVIKAALVKTVELDPKAVDDKLIAKAFEKIHEAPGR